MGYHCSRLDILVRHIEVTTDNLGLLHCFYVRHTKPFVSMAFNSESVRQNFHIVLMPERPAATS